MRVCTYVRELTLREGKRLSNILKTARSAVYLRRAQVVAFSGQGMRVQEIAKRLHLHEGVCAGADPSVRSRRV